MQQGTTIGPMMNGGPEDEGHLSFVDRHNIGRRFTEAEKSAVANAGKDARKALGGSEWTGKPAKSFMDEAMGVSRNKGRQATVTRSTAETTTPKKGGKKGPFGECYAPVKAPDKGVRSKEFPEGKKQKENRLGGLI